ENQSESIPRVMADYPLVRAQSSLALARSETRPALLSRTYSVPDLGQYFRWSDKYKPQWHSIRSYTPYRYRRDYELYDDYWYDRYYYFSPLYRSTYYPKRYSYSDSLPNPYYWSPYSSYWTRYKGYWYDYDYPSYYRRYYDSSYDRYLRSAYTPYRSYVMDSLSTSLGRGLSMYRAGLMDYSTLHNYWLTPSYWDRRFKDWRELYCTQFPSVNDTPSWYNRRAREYFTTWNNK
ncbi:hypothetical protein PFISCL1PPCAC_27688, partial [Pristionchus fissidentatus]